MGNSRGPLRRIIGQCLTLCRLDLVNYKKSSVNLGQVSPTMQIF